MYYFHVKWKLNDDHNGMNDHFLIEEKSREQEKNSNNNNRIVIAPHNKMHHVSFASLPLSALQLSHFSNCNLITSRYEKHWSFYEWKHELRRCCVCTLLTCSLTNESMAIVSFVKIHTIPLWNGQNRLNVSFFSVKFVYWLYFLYNFTCKTGKNVERQWF